MVGLAWEVASAVKLTGTGMIAYIILFGNITAGLGTSLKAHILNSAKASGSFRWDRCSKRPFTTGFSPVNTGEQCWHQG